MIHVIAVITARPGQRAAVDLDPALKFQTAFGPDSFLVIEKWESPEALKAHAAAPHMAAYAAKTKDLVAARKIYILQPAA